MKANEFLPVAQVDKRLIPAAAPLTAYLSGVSELEAWVTVDAAGFAQVDPVEVVIPQCSRARTLFVKGLGLNGFKCQTDTPALFKIRHGPDGIAISLGEASADVKLRLSYSLRLGSWHREVPGVYELTRVNLPHIRLEGDLSRPELQSPWQGRPSFRVNLRCAGEGLLAAGAVYPSEVSQTAAPCWTAFGRHEGTYPFRALVGPFKRVGGAELPIYLLNSAPLWSIDTALCGEIDAQAAHIRACFARWFGESPVCHKGIAMVSASGGNSASLGSFLLLNLPPVGPQLSVRDWQVRLFRLLSHEYAHTWWAYGAVWDSAQELAIINEMLAFTFEHLVASRLGHPDALKLAEEKRLSKVQGCLWHSTQWLRYVVPSFAGAWAAGPPVAYAQRDEAGLIRGFERIWALGKVTALPLEEVVGIFNEAAPRLGSAIRDGIRDPRPLIAEASVRCEGAAGWRLTLTLRPRPRLATWRAKSEPELRRRLEVATGRCPEDGEMTRLSYRFASLAELHEWMRAVRGSHLILARDAVAVGLARSILTGAWKAASRILDTDGYVGPLRVLAASMFAIALNPDDPRGFRKLADVLSRVSRHLARRVRHAAAARQLAVGID